MLWNNRTLWNNGMLRSNPMENRLPKDSQAKPDIRDIICNPNIDINKLGYNEFEQADGSVIAKIPQTKGRIYQRKDKDRNDVYITLLADAYYDPDKKQMRNIKVIIGSALSGRFEGWMLANEHYHEYYDREGNLCFDPLQKRREREAREKEEKEAAEKKKAAAETAAAKENKAERTETDKPHGNTVSNKPIMEEERTVDEIKASLLEKERELNEKLKTAAAGLKRLQEMQTQLNEMIEVRKYELGKKDTESIRFLNRILEHYAGTVQVQAKRKPDLLMRSSQIRAINDVLTKIRAFFAGTEAEDFLQLAEEPREDDLEHHPGTSYGEMDILLGAYMATIHTYEYGILYNKI